MTLYSAVILLTVVMMLSMIIHILHYSGFTAEQKRWYILTFSSIMVCTASEWATIHFNSAGPAFAMPLTVFTIVQFSLAPLLPVLFVGALGMHQEARLVGGFFFVNILVEILCAPFGLIFYFDANATYFHGNLYIIYEIFYLLSVVFLIISLVIVGKRFNKRDFRTIIMIFVLMAAAILPLLLYKVHADYIGIAFCGCLCYIFYDDLVQEDTRKELIANQERISGMQDHIITGLVNLIENRDMETGQHVARTSAYVKALAEDARKDGVYTDELTGHTIELLYRTAPMHDIGKIMVSDQILKKPGRLTAEEFELMKRHAAAGGDVTRDILTGITDEEYMSFAADIAMYHHERWDGTGYPHRLAGEQIPLGARIMAIADVFDALVSERCYKKPYPVDQAFQIIEEEAGTHFDPKLVKVFLDHREDFIRIQEAGSL